MKFEIGNRYKTKGGWIAVISTCANGNPQGWIRDFIGVKEPFACTWDESTGKCLKRGDSPNVYNTEFYDIIDTN